MSALRARCPHCRTLTAVAFEDAYECHSCGAAFAAGLVRVPRAWGVGGSAMEEAAHAWLPYPEALVVERDTLEEQSAAIAAGLPKRPFVLGGCCCAHIGAIRGLAARHDRLAVVWLDAHGDLNTPATSPSGNLWGMPLRMAIDEGSVARSDVALVGARDLDTPEEEYVAREGIDDDLARALGGATAVYVALDVDVLEPGEVPSFMPVAGGPDTRDVVRVIRDVAGRARVAGLGITGLVPGAAPETLTRFAVAAGL
ncbi:MAG TPA: arginase family protein [Gaiella sp.]|uniref:arginase family protein n=1 Tax=Gaiella sp. TaxID=2663207 RepID=UPI002D7FD713|nr:arginase family protein [Gaiella sp.]HET9286049.1 arginase family protein [Gaiella sp.]